MGDMDTLTFCSLLSTRYRLFIQHKLEYVCTSLDFLEHVLFSVETDVFKSASSHLNILYEVLQKAARLQ